MTSTPSSLSAHFPFYPYIDLTDSPPPLQVNQENEDKISGSGGNAQQNAQNVPTSGHQGPTSAAKRQSTLSGFFTEKSPDTAATTKSESQPLSMPSAKRARIQRNERIERFLEAHFPMTSTNNAETILDVKLHGPNKLLMYFVRIYSRSCLECKWVTEKGISNKALVAEANRRFYNNLMRPFDQEPTIPEAILAKKRGMYLVKWKELDYNQSTWEVNSKLNPSLERLVARYDTPEDKRLPRVQLTKKQNETMNGIKRRLADKKNFIVSVEVCPKVELIVQVLTAFQSLKQLNPSEKKKFLVLTQTPEVARVWEQIALETTWLNCVLYHGSSDDLNVVRELLLTPDFPAETKGEEDPSDLLIMTYKTFLDGFASFHKLKQTCIFVDSSLIYKADNVCDMLFMTLNSNKMATDSFGLMVDIGNSIIESFEESLSSIDFMRLNANGKESLFSMLVSAEPVKCSFINLAISSHTELQVSLLKDIYKKRDSLSTKQILCEMEKCTICPYLLTCPKDMSNLDVVNSSGMLKSFNIIYDKIDKNGPTTIAVFSKHNFVLAEIKKVLDKKMIATKMVSPYNIDSITLEPQLGSVVVLLCVTSGVVLSPFKSLNPKAAIFFDVPSAFSNIFYFDNSDTSVWFVLLSNSYKKKMYDCLNERFGQSLISLNALFTLDYSVLTENEIDFMYYKDNTLCKELLEIKSSDKPSTTEVKKPQNENVSVGQQNLSKVTENNGPRPAELPQQLGKVYDVTGHPKNQLNTGTIQKDQPLEMVPRGGRVLANFGSFLNVQCNLVNEPVKINTILLGRLSMSPPPKSQNNVEPQNVRPNEKSQESPLPVKSFKGTNGQNVQLSPIKCQLNEEKNNSNIKSVCSPTKAQSSQNTNPSSSEPPSNTRGSNDKFDASTEMLKSGVTVNSPQKESLKSPVKKPHAENGGDNDDKIDLCTDEPEILATDNIALDMCFFTDETSPKSVNPKMLFEYLKKFGWGRFNLIKEKYKISESEQCIEVGSVEILLFALDKINVDVDLYARRLFLKSVLKCKMTSSLIIEYCKIHINDIKKCKIISACFKSNVQTRIFLDLLFTATKLHNVPRDFFSSIDPKFRIPWWNCNAYEDVLKEINENGTSEFYKIVGKPELAAPVAQVEKRRFDLMRVFGPVVIDWANGQACKWTCDSFKVVADYIKHMGLRKYAKDKMYYAKVAIIDTHLVSTVSTEMVINLIDKSIVNGEPNPDLDEISGSEYITNGSIEENILLKMLEFFEFYNNIKMVFENPQNYKKFLEKLSYPLKGFPWWNESKYDAFALYHIVKSGFMRLVWHACTKAVSPFRKHIPLKAKVYKSLSWELYSNCYKLKVFPGVSKLFERYKNALSALESEKSFCDVIFGNPHESNQDSADKIVIKRFKRSKDGFVMLPIYVCFDLAVEKIGEIEVGDKRYYTENYIFPVGYRAVRLIICNFQELERFVCTIERGEDGPNFVVSGDGSRHVGRSPAEAWKQALCGREFDISLITEKSGYDLFGFNTHQVAYLIQGLPFICTCTGYVPKMIVEEPEIYE